MEQNAEISTPITPMSDNNKSSSKNGLKITTAIACIIAVCGVGFGIYGMIQSSQKDNQISDLKIEINEKTAKVEELETKISNLNGKIEELTASIETASSDTAEQASNNSDKTAAILLGTILGKNDNSTTFKIGDCTADAPSVKCPVTVNGKDALISYNDIDSLLRLTLPNN